jgi:hypothetical protein
MVNEERRYFVGSWVFEASVEEERQDAETPRTEEEGRILNSKFCIASVLFLAVGCAPLRKVDGGGLMAFNTRPIPAGIDGMIRHSEFTIQNSEFRILPSSCLGDLAFALSLKSAYITTIVGRLIIGAAARSADPT